MLTRFESVLIRGTKVLVIAAGGIGPGVEVIAPPIVLVVPSSILCHEFLLGIDVNFQGPVE
jgi:hypothetical protein